MRQNRDFFRVLQRFLYKPEKAAYLFLLPAFVVFAIFVIMPLLSGLGISFLNMDIFLNKIRFVGIENFKELLRDERFWNSMKNTFYFAGMQVPLQVGLALFVAAFVSKNTFFRKSLRSIFFIPVVCSMTSMGILWSLLLDPVLGIYPYFLKLIGFSRVAFLKDPVLAMPTIVLMTTWKNFGFSMTILVAGLQGVPEVYYEAAAIDGANRWKQFRHITLPLLIPTLSFCIVTNTIGSLQVFDQVFVMTQGGPLYRTETAVMYIYYRGFQIPPFNLGYTSAIAIILFIIIATISLLVYNFFLKRETTY